MSVLSLFDKKDISTHESVYREARRAIKDRQLEIAVIRVNEYEAALDTSKFTMNVSYETLAKLQSQYTKQEISLTPHKLKQLQVDINFLKKQLAHINPQAKIAEHEIKLSELKKDLSLY